MSPEKTARWAAYEAQRTRAYAARAEYEDAPAPEDRIKMAQAMIGLRHLITFSSVSRHFANLILQSERARKRRLAKPGKRRPIPTGPVYPRRENLERSTKKWMADYQYRVWRVKHALEDPSMYLSAEQMIYYGVMGLTKEERIVEFERREKERKEKEERTRAAKVAPTGPAAPTELILRPGEDARTDIRRAITASPIPRPTVERSHPQDRSGMETASDIECGGMTPLLTGRHDGQPGRGIDAVNQSHHRPSAHPPGVAAPLFGACTSTREPVFKGNAARGVICADRAEQTAAPIPTPHTVGRPHPEGCVLGQCCPQVKVSTPRPVGPSCRPVDSGVVPPHSISEGGSLSEPLR